VKPDSPSHDSVLLTGLQPVVGLCEGPPFITTPPGRIVGLVVPKDFLRVLDDTFVRLAGEPSDRSVPSRLTSYGFGTSFHTSQRRARPQQQGVWRLEVRCAGFGVCGCVRTRSSTETCFMQTR
jgi:hypothetical protein